MDRSIGISKWPPATENSDGRVTLREFREADIPTKVEWVNNPENNRHLHYELPLEEAKTREWFKNKKSNRYDAVIEYGGVPVGLIGLLGMAEGRAEYYIMLGEPAYKGKGIARRASELLLTYAKSRLRLEEIYLYTEVENQTAQRLFERLGFEKKAVEKGLALNRGEKVDRYYYIKRL